MAGATGKLSLNEYDDDRVSWQSRNHTEILAWDELLNGKGLLNDFDNCSQRFESTVVYEPNLKE